LSIRLHICQGIRKKISELRENQFGKYFDYSKSIWGIQSDNLGLEEEIEQQIRV
jgi:hypothetical protein